MAFAWAIPTATTRIEPAACLIWRRRQQECCNAFAGADNLRGPMDGHHREHWWAGNRSLPATTGLSPTRRRATPRSCSSNALDNPASNVTNQTLEREIPRSGSFPVRLLTTTGDVLSGTGRGRQAPTVDGWSDRSMTTSASVAMGVTFPVAPDSRGLGPPQAIAWNIVGSPTQNGRFSVDGARRAAGMRFRPLRIPGEGV